MIPVPLRVQLAGVKEPLPLDEKYTSPIGIVAPVPDVSVTVAIQAVFELTAMDDGLQLKLVEVERPDITETIRRPALAT